jgi:hypothetical protein
MHVFSGEERGEAEANRSFHWTNGKNHGTSVFFFQQTIFDSRGYVKFKLIND